MFLLNQDAWVEPNTIEELINVSAKNPEFYLLSPVHLNKEGRGFDEGFMHYALPPFCDNFFYDSFSSCQKELYPTTFVNATAWILKIKTIHKIGLFDPIFYHYGEDKDYCNRLLFHKKQIGIVPSARVYHARESSSLNNNNFIKNIKRSVYQNYFPILVELKNLDQNLFKLTLNFVFSLVLSTVKKIVFLKFRKAVLELMLIFRIIMDYSKIKLHRKISHSKEAFINS